MRNEQLSIWKQKLEEALNADPDCFSFDPEEGNFETLSDWIEFCESNIEVLEFLTFQDFSDMPEDRDYWQQRETTRLLLEKHEKGKYKFI